MVFSKTPPLAPHVLRALGPRFGANAPAQPKEAGAQAMATHVQQAVARTRGAAQPWLAQPSLAPGQRLLAAHVLQGIGRANVQRSQAPQVRGPGRWLPPATVQLMMREPRQVKNANLAQRLYDALVIAISNTGAVGQVDGQWVVENDDDDDSYACDAAASTGAMAYAGSYSGSTGIHAEMAALANFVANGSGRFSDLQTIRITKPTCPRCAYVLKSLRIDDKVRYPKGTDLGNRKGPGWKMPEGLKDPMLYDDPLDGAMSDFMGAGYSREEGLALVVRALQSA